MIIDIEIIKIYYLVNLFIYLFMKGLNIKPFFASSLKKICLIKIYILILIFLIVY